MEQCRQGKSAKRIRNFGKRIGSEEWARGSRPRTRRLSADCSSCSRGESGSPRDQLEQSADSRRVRGRDPRAQSSEPILFPKLRIRFADFPCLHCSIGQRLFTLET
uniref:Uncharacterized protein n=1 Tax=Avena sativa TaxID=4498 RepID=A0ACD6ASC6_AVESA